MNKTMLVALAAAMISVSTFGAEKIDGIFGVKLGEQPKNAATVAAIRSLNAELVMVNPENDEIQRCVALVGSNGVSVAIMCHVPWTEEVARKKVVNGWAAKYGKPAISGTDSDEMHKGSVIKYDTYVSEGRALAFVRQEKMVMLECADIASLTNMLGQADGKLRTAERAALGLVGKVVGYDIDKELKKADVKSEN